MTTETAIILLMGTMFVAITSLYVWTTKIYRSTNETLGKIYATVNGHIQNSKVHIKAEDGYTSERLCATLHVGLKESMDEIKKDVKHILERME